MDDKNRSKALELAIAGVEKEFGKGAIMRLKDGDTCESIVKGLQDNFDAKGKLTVKLQAPPPTGGDCFGNDRAAG